MKSYWIGGPSFTTAHGIFVCLVSWFAATIGFQIDGNYGGVGPIALSSGVGLYFAVVFGKKFLVPVALGNLFAALSGGFGVESSFAFSFVHALEGALVLFLLNQSKLSTNSSHRSFQLALTLGLICFLPAALSAGLFSVWHRIAEVNLDNFGVEVPKDSIQYDLLSAWVRYALGMAFALPFAFPKVFGSFRSISIAAPEPKHRQSLQVAINMLRGFVVSLLIAWAIFQHTQPISSITVVSNTMALLGFAYFSSLNLNSSVRFPSFAAAGLLTGSILLSSSLQVGIFQKLSEADRTETTQLILASLLFKSVFFSLVFQALDRVKSLLIILVFLLGSNAILVAKETSLRQESEKEFDTLIATARATLDSKLSSYESALNAGVAFFAGTSNVSASEWKIFVEKLRLFEQNPGLMGMGAIYNVPVSSTNEFLKIENDGLNPKFALRFLDSTEKNKGEVTADNNGQILDSKSNYVITLIEPREINKSAVGLVISSEAKRRQAADLAKSTNALAVTSVITLVQDKQKGPGFLALVPFSRKDISAIAKQDLHGKYSLSGWIYAPFTAQSFFQDIQKQLPHGLNFEVYDASFGKDPLFSSAPLQTSDFYKKETINFGQRSLDLSWTSNQILAGINHQAIFYHSRQIEFFALALSGIIIFLFTSGRVSRQLAETKALENDQLNSRNSRTLSLINNIPNQAIVLIDSEGEVLTWSAGAESLTGYSPQERIGLKFYECFRFFDSEVGRSRSKRVYENGLFEGLDCRKDGSEFWARANFSKLADTLTSDTYFTLVVIDISEQNNREKQLQQSLRSLQLASKAGKMGFFYWKLSENSIDFTEDALQLMGIGKEEALKSTSPIPFHLLMTDDQKKVQSKIQVFLQSANQSLQLDYQIISPGQSNIWMQTLLFTELNVESVRPEAVVGYHRDITAEKIAKIKLQQSERKLKSALESSKDSAIEWDCLTGELSISAGLAETLGCSTSEYVPSIASLRAFVNSSDLRMLRQRFTEHRVAATLQFECEMRVKDTQGKWMWYLFRASTPHKGTENDEADGGEKVTGVLFNIDKMKRVEGHFQRSELTLLQTQKELVAKNIALEEATVAKSKFLATMSHEIRTPLNGVLGMAELISASSLDEDQSNLIRIIQQSGTNLLNLINDVLDFSKLEAGKIQLERNTFALARLLEDQIEILHSKAVAKNLFLQSYCKSGMPFECIGDSGRISQVLLNLLGNAIKFTATGFVTLRAIPAQNREPDWIRFEIADSGIGLSEDQVNKLFTPFQQADSSTSRKYGGTGLGLSISKALVEAMGGEIGIMSAFGKGSTFWFEIPLEQSLSSPHGPILPAEINSLETIYVYEENDFLRELLEDYCKSWKISVVVLDHNLSIANMAESGTFNIKHSSDEKAYGLLIGSGETLPLQNHWNAALKLISVTLMNAELAGSTVKANKFVSRLSTPMSASTLFNTILSTLPTHKLKNEPDLAQSQNQQTVAKKDLHILIAEDNPINQMLAQRLVKSLGYNCDIVADGNEAIKALEFTSYDLILMDCQMPEMDGFAATKIIRSMAGTRANIPIIALTANALAGDKELCLESGMSDYLTKPISKQTLENKLQEWTSNIKEIDKLIAS